jgi:hypothetical protein
VQKGFPHRFSGLERLPFCRGSSSDSEFDPELVEE